MKSGRIFAINRSKIKGTLKKSVKEAVLTEDFGMEGDSHAGSGLRQVSLLSIESIRKQVSCSKINKKDVSLKPGDFAENITTEGLDLTGLKIKDNLKIGKQVIIEISKIGKECHKHCVVYDTISDCIMPREGIFAKVLQSGKINTGDEIRVI